MSAFGYDTTVMVRSILLRGFDRDMATKIGKYMEAYHTKFIHDATPSKLEISKATGKILVTYEQGDQELKDEFDTVLFAIGRYA